MIKHHLIVYIVITFCFSISSGQERNLVWEDNFDGPELNKDYWSFQLGDGCPHLCGWGNNEKQIYTKSNHKIRDGLLVITARKENSRYSSTRITTKAKQEFQYGYIEMRAKLPEGKGIWPAFWLLGSNIEYVGWPDCGEIDIMEFVGRQADTIYTSVHTRSSFGNTVNTKHLGVTNLQSQFHIYALDWSSDKLDFLVDDKLLYSYAPKLKNDKTWPFDQPFYILINMAIGGNFAGHDVDDSIFPQEYTIDYIKVFK